MIYLHIEHNLPECINVDGEDGMQVGLAEHLVTLRQLHVPATDLAVDGLGELHHIPDADLAHGVPTLQQQGNPPFLLLCYQKNNKRPSNIYKEL